MDSSMVPSEMQPTFYVGHHDSERVFPASSRLLNQAHEAGYDMITSPITNAAFHDQVLSSLDDYQSSIKPDVPPLAIPSSLVPPLTPHFTSLSPDTSLSSILALTSPWIDVGSPDPVVAHVSLQVLNQEVAYAAFCGINNIIIRGPSTKAAVHQYAHAIKHTLEIGPYLQLHVSLPMSDIGSADPVNVPDSLRSRSHKAQHVQTSEIRTDVDHFDTYDAWDLIRSVCSYHSRLSIALTIPQKIPSQALQSRWYSEPLRIITFSKSAFVPNAKGYPVLPKEHQNLIFNYMRLRQPPWMLLSDIGRIPTGNRLEMKDVDMEAPTPTPAEAASFPQKPSKPADPSPHLQYLRHLQQTQPPRSVIDRFAAGYQDYLQSPLQPLADNLESITYEVFEKDPIKYAWYERATALALTDLHKTLQRPIRVAVVGAGRGPLVTRALNASVKTQVPIEMHAVEKNPNAYVLLLKHNTTNALWNGRVKVVKSDMRSWPGPTLPTGETGHVDILISELLGSFADNELSPECLDGIQRVLHPVHGVNIPQSYTAHLAPIATPRIHQDLLHRSGSGDKWSIPYVVMLHQYDDLATLPLGQPDIKQAWEFSHPMPPSVIAESTHRRGGGGVPGIAGGDGANEHNARFSSLTFRVPHRGACHGLAGYFETVLYHSVEQGEIVELSTNPLTMDAKSRDMISWFPIFFPIKTPLLVPDDGEVVVSMWRRTDDRKVWYEWLLEVWVEINGRRMRMGVSELHSSVGSGCLM